MNVFYLPVAFLKLMQMLLDNSFSGQIVYRSLLYLSQPLPELCLGLAYLTQDLCLLIHLHHYD